MTLVNGSVSYWFREIGMPAPRAALPGSLHADVCIVGAGYTGLWTAYYLKREQPELRIVLLEREFAGFGASGRNGGWVVAELAGSRDLYARKHGRAAAIDLQRAMFDTVDEVVKTVAAEGIDADVVKNGVLYVATGEVQQRRVEAEIAESRGWGWGEDDLRLLEAGEKINVTGATGASWSPHCARIQPAKLAVGLAETVRRLGVEIYEQTAVTEILPRRGPIQACAITPHGTVSAAYVLRATEGFTAEFTAHHRDWLPMNSSLIVTEPLPAEAWDKIGWAGSELLGDMAHYYMYAQRTADGRIAFGGRGVPYRYGSKVDDAGSTPEKTISTLRGMLGTMFPAAARIPIAHAWSGVLGVPRDWCSTVDVDHVTGLGHAGGYTGHGVATTNLAGRTLRDLVLRRDTALTALPWVGWKVRRWEPEPLRWIAVQTMYRMYQAADAREARHGRASRIATMANLISGRH
jgi:glycine/D-amino acid oxidase-like deaminating enzyme